MQNELENLALYHLFWRKTVHNAKTGFEQNRVALNKNSNHIFSGS